MRRVLFLVCHLTGSGHLSRTLALAKAVTAAGGTATVVSGGRPMPHLDAAGVDLVQLPPLAVVNFDYRRLLTVGGAPAGERFLSERRAALCGAIEATQPEILVTELFPFGRRALAAEFTLAVEMARARGAAVFASVRDIVEPPRKPGRAAEAHARLRDGYDGVLVHGDPWVAPFAAGWPAASEIATFISHTGYVADPPHSPLGDREEVLVAEGGGVLGDGLLEAAVEAARMDDGRTWRLRVGGAEARARTERVARAARGGPVIVEPAAADYRSRLMTCAASVSRLGYMTATDLLASRAPAVVSPFGAAGEREQALRAEAFAKLAQFHRVGDDPADILAAVRRARACGRGERAPVRLDGAATTARILLG